MYYFGQETSMRVAGFLKQALGHHFAAAIFIPVFGSAAIVGTLLYAPNQTPVLGVAVFGTVVHFAVTAVAGVQSGELKSFSEQTMDHTYTEAAALLAMLAVYVSLVLAIPVTIAELTGAAIADSMWLYAAFAYPIIDNELLRRAGISPAAVVPAVVLLGIHAAGGLERVTLAALTTFGQRRGGVI